MMADVKIPGLETLRDQFNAQCVRARWLSEDKIRRNAAVSVVLGRGGSAQSGARYPTTVHIFGGGMKAHVWRFFARSGRRYRVLCSYKNGQKCESDREILKKVLDF